MKDARYLLDASALLALLLNEPAAPEVLAVIRQSSIHSVNLVEVITKLIQKGVPDPGPVLASLPLEVLSELTAEEAARCGQLHADTRSQGLSFGDCICLGVAETRGLVAVTREKLWAKVAEPRHMRVMVVPMKSSDLQ
jgi:PIN domain nuclease of toxin-antitoxin system